MKIESLEQSEYKCHHCHNYLFRSVSITENGMGERIYQNDRLGCLHCGTEETISSVQAKDQKRKEAYQDFLRRADEIEQKYKKEFISRFYTWEKTGKEKGEEKDVSKGSEGE